MSISPAIVKTIHKSQLLNWMLFLHSTIWHTSAKFLCVRQSTMAGRNVVPVFSKEYFRKATKWGGVSESPYKKGGPVSVLGRAR